MKFICALAICLTMAVSAFSQEPADTIDYETARLSRVATAVRAEETFTRVVREGQAPTDLPELPLPDADLVHLPALLVELGIPSTSEARRLIAQAAVRVDDEVITELDVPRERLAGAVLQAGKRRFARLTET